MVNVVYRVEARYMTNYIELNENIKGQLEMIEFCSKVKQFLELNKIGE